MSRLYKEKIGGESLGIYFGTFAPMHIGHYEAVMQAKRENDACIVVVSGYKGDRGDQIGLDLVKRFRYIRELFADDENVYVEMLDESDIPRYPDGWEPWLDNMSRIVENATEGIFERMTWYVGEEDYVDELLQRTADEVFYLDRQVIPVSATQIRENPMKHWRYITKPFRRHFSTNILVMGTASNGKTTLVRDLARYFDAPFTDEYARRYEEESNVRDEELVANDFHYLASGQFDNNRNTISGPDNNGLFIADTDVMVTKVYSKVYLDEKDHERLVPMYDMMIEKQKWDLILVIPPVTEYVDDNFRDMTHSDDAFRWNMHELMLEEIKANGLEDKMVIIDSWYHPEETYDKQGFHARYAEAQQVIQDYVQNTYGVEAL